MNAPRPSFLRRRLVSGCVVLTGLAWVQFGVTGGLPGLLADLREYGQRSSQLKHDTEVTESLDERIAVSAVRTEYRLELLDRLMARQVTLRQACEEFRAFVGPDPCFDRMLLAITSGADDTEHVANYLLTSLVKPRGLDAATRDRLAAEFHAEFGRAPDFAAPPLSESGPVGHTPPPLPPRHLRQS